MKKFASVLLALLLLAGFCVFAGAIELDTPEVVEVTEHHTPQLRFSPAATGWYTFEGESPNTGVYLSFHLSGSAAPDAVEANTVLTGSGGGVVGYLTAGRRKIGMQSYYLEAGQSYEVQVLCAVDTGLGFFFDVSDTPTVVVRKAESVTGRGPIAAKNLELDVGAPVRADDLFTAPPPYSLLRVVVLGDAVGQDFIAKKAGASTLVFYDWAGNEVGRSTVTVPAWWQTLPPFLRFLLRWLAFGWIWMN